jgi:glycosyltransferase involved in cell wall biosynthesis
VCVPDWFSSGVIDRVVETQVNVALVLFELARHSYLRGEVWGEEIDAQCMQKAFLRRPGVSTCDLLTINSYLALRGVGALAHYDLAIHFFEPSVIIPEAVNILYFQQFYDLERHDLDGLCRHYDRVFTPARAIATTFKQIDFLPLAVDGDLYRPLEGIQEDEYRSDVVFVGNAHIREDATYRELLSPFLGLRLAIYGARWDRPEYQEWAHRWRGVLALKDASKAYAGASVALSIHNRRYLKDLQFVTSRPFHTLACGRPTVSDTNSVLAELLPPETSGLRHATTAEEFTRSVLDLLHDRGLGEELGSIGRRYVLQNHSWDVRIGQLLASL